jgi:outer membrane lipoprotein-sorting protein
MKKFFLFLLTLSVISASAQTADEVIDKYIQAIGGKEVLGKIKTMVVETELGVMGNSFNGTTTLVVDKGYRSESVFNGESIIQALTPTGGWMVNPLAGISTPQAIPDDQFKTMKGTLSLGGDLIGYKENGGKAELAGNEKIGAINAIKVKVTAKDGKETTYYFDPATNYQVKREAMGEMMGQSTKIEMTFSDYRKTDIGYVMPFTTVVNQGFEVTINTKKVEFNKEIDLKIFEMPK